jgi:hypothetical protein
MANSGTLNRKLPDVPEPPFLLLHHAKSNFEVTSGEEILLP